MKLLKPTAAAAVIFALLTSLPVLTGAEENALDQCKRYAKEDGVGPEEMDSYVKECMASFGAAYEPDPEAPNPRVPGQE